MLPFLIFGQPLLPLHLLANPQFNKSQEFSILRHVYLTWQRDPCHTITINIQGLKTPEELIVYYDTQPRHSKIYEYAHKISGLGTKFTQLPDGRYLYHIELTHLASGTTYYFTIGDKIHAFGSEKSFRTIPDDDRPFLIIEGGDWENSAAAETLAAKAASLSPYAVWLGGDYPSHVYGVGDYEKWDYWLDVYSRTMVTPEGVLIPMVMAIGNHEVIGGFNQPKEQAPFFFHYFKQGDTGESYFSLPFGKHVHLMILDSGHTAIHGGKQKNWLKEELKKTSKVPIRIALYHVPLFPSVRFAEKDMIYSSIYGVVELWKDQNTANKLFSQESFYGRRHWLPLFDAYELTVAFEHHDQTLKRTKLIRRGKEDPKGTLYLGDGGWGPEVQYPPIQGYFHNYFANLQGKEHFFWAVTIDPKKITYHAITASGKVIDRFVQKL